MNCHFCGTELQIKIDLGRQPLANALLDNPDQEEFFYEGKWGWCPECQLLQLANPPTIEQMFTGDYPFITDSSKVMVEHFKKTAEMLTARYGLTEKSLVVEIGCNSGGMIEHLDCPRLGYETSESCIEYLLDKGISFLPEYFDENSARIADSVNGQKVDLIYSANTLRSIPQLESIFKGAYSILKDDGVFVIEEPYLLSILEGGEIDQFYDENVYCFTVTSMDKLAHRYGFKLESIAYLPTHGGSMRYHLTRDLNQLGHNAVFVAIEYERAIPEMLDKFWLEAQRTAIQFQEELIRSIATKKRVIGYGATAKSSVMLNFIDEVDIAAIECIYDTTPSKWGKYSPGQHIPIKDAKDFANDDADIVVLFAWNHAKEIVERENKIKSRKWLVYVPNGVHYL